MKAENINILPTEDTSLPLAQLLKACGDSLRLDILRTLSKDSFGVLELADIFSIKQSGMSHHLKVLAKADLVDTRREGNSIFYRRATLSHASSFVELKQTLFNAADQLPINDARQRTIQEVYEQRAKTSQVFFSEHAKQIREQQELIAAFSVYQPHVQALIKNIKFTAPKTHLRALEIGPGAGELITFLAERFASLTALDNNSKMLELAAQNNTHLKNVVYQHNDTSYCRENRHTFDCVVANMVLHHTPSPQQIFSDVSQSLKPQASFIVCDLTQHDQDWARQACGDQWLGFAPDDLTEWANENNLIEGQSDYFALRNGFQIQIRQFIKQ